MNVLLWKNEKAQTDFQKGSGSEPKLYNTLWTDQEEKKRRLENHHRYIKYTRNFT